MNRPSKEEMRNTVRAAKKMGAVFKFRRVRRGQGSTIVADKLWSCSFYRVDHPSFLSGPHPTKFDAAKLFLLWALVHL